MKRFLNVDAWDSIGFISSNGSRHTEALFYGMTSHAYKFCDFGFVLNLTIKCKLWKRFLHYETAYHGAWVSMYGGWYLGNALYGFQRHVQNDCEIGFNFNYCNEKNYKI